MPKKKSGRERLISKIRRTVGGHGMLCRGECVLLAVSGGADSMTMLRLLVDSGLRDELGLRFIVCHLNHGMRGAESRRDYDFVKAAAGRLGLEFIGRTLKPGVLRKKGSSLQEEARARRYRFFEEAAMKRGDAKVAIGHTLDDQAETVLMRLIKGSGIKGLTGIPPVRGRFIRPLIEVSREEIEKYAKDTGLEYVVDSTNRRPKYLRNSIRLKLIPFIKKEYNPNIIETLARTARLLALDSAYLDKEASRLLDKTVIERKRDAVVLDRKMLMSMDKALAARVLLNLAQDRGVELYSSHIKSFLEVTGGQRPNASVRIAGGLGISMEYGRVILRFKAPGKPKKFERVLSLPGVTRVTGTGYSFKAELTGRPPSLKCGPNTAFFDYGAVLGPVMARTVMPGDRMVPLGMKGHKKIKEIFIDNKVPMERRRSIPLLVCGGAVMWAPGIRQSELFKVTSSTKRVLKVEFIEKKPQGDQGIS